MMSNASAPRSGLRGQQTFNTALRITVTSVVLVWIARRLDWESAGRVFQEGDFLLIGLVPILHIIGLLLSTEKWRLILAVHGAIIRTDLLVRWYLIAGFLNLLFPSSIGGDAYRIMKTWPSGSPGSVAGLAVLEERITGILGLFIVGFAAATVISRTGEARIADQVLAVGKWGSVACLLGFLVMRMGFLRRLVDLLRRTLPRVSDLVYRIADFRHRPACAVRVALLSVGFHMVKVLGVWMLVHSLGGDVDFRAVAIGTLLAELAGLLPITLGGLGVTEGAFMLVMEQFGLSAAVAVASMLLLRLTVLPLAVIGGGLYLLTDGPEKQEQGSDTSKADKL